MGEIARLLFAVTLSACAGTASPPVIDRFSPQAGTMHRRSSNLALPRPGQPVFLDASPFVRRGLGPRGEIVTYYDLDLRSELPARAYRLVQEGAADGRPEEGLVFEKLPGEPGYNDFVRILHVTVPPGADPARARDARALPALGWDVTDANVIWNAPIMPPGSRALRRSGKTPKRLLAGWWQSRPVAYFLFEDDLRPTAGGKVPASTIFVFFANGRDPSDGFLREPGNPAQTHNLLATVPGDRNYSPHWEHLLLPNSAFDRVRTLEDAEASDPQPMPGVTVNCPVVAVEAARLRGKRG